ncbi:hypothetical protein BDZ94DRAFT_965478 [Collybia nuda]|uniref:Uncharacterized protein n=1 Tax=Collybia nuda TaxID=64659 RepID=A0A9P5YF60_9AGAR|nr:hypothetical protein BDZ94DRAFT_965478 [Collybia nuda]
MNLGFLPKPDLLTLSHCLWVVMEALTRPRVHLWNIFDIGDDHLVASGRMEPGCFFLSSHPVTPEQFIFGQLWRCWYPKEFSMFDHQDPPTQNGSRPYYYFALINSGSQGGSVATHGVFLGLRFRPRFFD